MQPTAVSTQVGLLELTQPAGTRTRADWMGKLGSASYDPVGSWRGFMTSLNVAVHHREAGALFSR